MRNKKSLKSAIKGIITVSTMLAVNDIFGYFAPTRTSQTVHRIGNNIAGVSVGLLIGEIAADAVLARAERIIAAYKGEILYSEDE